MPRRTPRSRWLIAIALEALPILLAQEVPKIFLRVSPLQDSILIEVDSATNQFNRLESSEDLRAWRTCGVAFNAAGTTAFTVERPGQARFFRATFAAPDAPLNSLAVAPAVAAESTLFRTLNETGGTLEGAGVRVEFGPGDISGEVRAALVPGPDPEPETSATWAARIRGIGRSYSLATRGDGMLRSGRIVFNFDPAQVPEGWEPRVLYTSVSARAAPILAALPSTGETLFTPKQRTPAEESLITTETGRLIERGPPEMNPPAARLVKFRSFACAEQIAPGRLETPVLAGDAPGLTQLFELVLAEKAQSARLEDAPGRPIACVFFLRPPPHGKEEYLRRLDAALRRAIARGRRLGIPDPPFPLSITVTDELKSGPGAFDDQLQAATSGTRIALRSDLMVQWPLDHPGALEYAVSHEYFHVLEAFSMSMATYNDPRNDWALEGGAEWFAHSIFENYREKWPAPVTGLEQSSYHAAPFWMYLHERFDDRIMTETLDLLRAAALGGRQFNDLSLRIAFGLRLEMHGVTEALDRVLRRRNANLSDVFGDFAASYLYRRDFERGDQGTRAHPGLWYGLAPFEFPFENPAAWRELTLAGATTNDPVVLDNLTVRELSAAAIRFTDPFDRGRFHFLIENPRVVLGALEPSFCRELGPPRLRLQLFGEKTGAEPELVHDSEIGSEGVHVAIESIGRSGRFGSVVAVVANVAWRIRRDCSESPSQWLETGMGDVNYRIRAYLDEREADRAPTAAYVSVPAGGKRWCISKQRSEDEDGNRCFGSFTQAISNREVQDFHELVVDPDTYEEQVVVTKSLIIRPKIPGTVVIKSSGQVVTIAARDVIFSNFILIGGGNTVPVVGGTPQGHAASLQGNIIVSRGPGIQFFESDGHLISHNWIAARQGGISLSDSAGSVIADNVIAPPYLREGLAAPEVTGSRVETPLGYAGVIDEAISLARCGGITVSHNESITWDWLPTGSFDGGLEAIDVSGLTVVSNLFRAAGGGFKAVRCDHVTLEGNLMAGLEGAVVTETSELTLLGNLLQGKMRGMVLDKVSSARFLTNRFVPGSTSWSLSGSSVTGLTSLGDRIDGMSGGGATFTGSARLFFQGTTFRGNDTACELWDTPSTTFLDCAFEHASRNELSSKPGEGGGLVARRSDQITVRGARFKGPNIAIDVQDGTHLPWENLLIDSDGGIGAYATRAGLTLRNVTFRPEIAYPFGAREGSIQLQDVRFAHAEGEAVAKLFEASLSQGVLEFQPLPSKEAFAFTSLTPWWWQVGAQGGDYRFEFRLDLDSVAVPTAPRPDEVRLASIFWEPPYYPGQAVINGNLIEEVRSVIEYNAMGGHNTSEFGIVAIPPEAEYP